MTDRFFWSVDDMPRVWGIPIYSGNGRWIRGRKPKPSEPEAESGGQPR